MDSYSSCDLHRKLNLPFYTAIWFTKPNIFSLGFFSDFQALFYIPRYIWKVLEGGYLRNMFEGFKKAQLKPTVKEQNVSDVAKIDHIERCFRPHRHSNNLYCFKFMFANYFLNGVILMIVWKCTHALLNERFYTYGSDLIAYLTQPEFEKAEYLINPMDVLFPKMTKCEYRRIGLSGTNETHGALCIVLLNILNEKIFFALWILYVALSSILSTSAAARITFYLCRPLRLVWIMKTTKVSKFSAELIDADCSVGDLFMLEQISNVTYPYIFYQFIDTYARNLRWARGFGDTMDEEDEFENCRQPWIRKMIKRKALRLSLMVQNKEELRALLEEDGDFDDEERLRKNPSLQKFVSDKAESLVKRHCHF